MKIQKLKDKNKNKWKKINCIILENFLYIFSNFIFNFALLLIFFFIYLYFLPKFEI